jgi:hypothetical protein
MDKYNVLKDGSVVVYLYDKDYTEAQKYHDDDQWFEVYNSENIVDPVPGKCYNIGSGEYIIISEDSLYMYGRMDGKFYSNMALKRYDPNSIAHIVRVKQSPISRMDDYVTYIRVIAMN